MYCSDLEKYHGVSTDLRTLKRRLIKCGTEAVVSSLERFPPKSLLGAHLRRLYVVGRVTIFQLS